MSARKAGDRFTPGGGIPAHVAVLEPRFLCSAVPTDVAPEPLAPVAASAVHASAKHRKSSRLSPVLVPANQQSIPQFHSDPAAPVQVYLDFTGAPATSWGGQTVPATSAYDTDGNPATFSATELANIAEIWSRVAEKFSPFHLDVTTVDPGAYVKGQTLRIVVGGDGAWTGGTYGGYSIPDGFQSDTPTSWIFPANLGGGDPKDVAEAIAHEMGHDFGLEHQSVFSGTTKLNEYNSGTAQEAPIMGRSYNAQRGVWWVGLNSNGVIQDDMAVIADAQNGFGYRPEDHGQTVSTADPLNEWAGILSASGVITTTADTDMFAFNTQAPATVTFTANVAEYGPMLHLKLLLLDSGGTVIRTADSDSLGQSLCAALPAGSYRIEVASHGGNGDVGQYSLCGMLSNFIQAKQGPMILAAGPDGSGLSAQIGNGRIRLNWSRGWSHGNRMTLERSADSGTTWSELTTLRPNATTFTQLITSKAGSVCCYRIVSSGKRAQSDPVVIATPAAGIQLTGLNRRRASIVQ